MASGAQSSVLSSRGRALACAAVLCCAAQVSLACDRSGRAPTNDADPDAAPPWDVAQIEPEPRPGMVWIPPGVLIAGTPPDKLPRIADEEMAGEQVVMRGFYMDAFPFPNEVGAIPTTNVAQEEARALCEGQGKRLCTELEIERACKGPANTTYEYGDVYKASICGTGQTRALTPNGVNASCVSGFGVHDLHGGVWTWTSSQWQRDSAKTGLVTLRGGDSPLGELVGRCAHGRGAKPDVRRPEVGVRCCAGEANSFEVVLEVVRDRPLRLQQLVDARLGMQLEQLVPEDVLAPLRSARSEAPFKVERIWAWHPLGNEELVIGGGCAREAGVSAEPGSRTSSRAGGKHAVCGIVIARRRLDAAALLAFVPSDRWQPTLAEADSPRELHLFGGDPMGAFRRRVSYEWGRVGVAEKERKRKRKGRREPSYD